MCADHHGHSPYRKPNGILDLYRERLEVCRDPDGDAETYRDRQVLERDAVIAPLAKADAQLAVADLLP